jgi:hypothetical protein
VIRVRRLDGQLLGIRLDQLLQERVAAGLVVPEVAAGPEAVTTFTAPYDKHKR